MVSRDQKVVEENGAGEWWLKRTIEVKGTR